MQPLMERIWKRIKGWKEILISREGKEMLIKAVAQEIPMYTMSHFLIPNNLCREIKSLMCKFWWGSQENDKKIRWLSYEGLCW